MPTEKQASTTISNEDTERSLRLEAVARDAAVEDGWFFHDGVNVCHDMSLYIDPGHTFCGPCARLFETLLARTPALADKPETTREAPSGVGRSNGAAEDLAIARREFVDATLVVGSESVAVRLLLRFR